MSDVPLQKHLEDKIDEMCKRHEAQIKSLCSKNDLRFKAIEEKIAARDKAQELQDEQNKAHFIALNNEAARIQSAAEKAVSRDTWNAFKQQYDDWQRKVEVAVGGLLPAKDFNEFRDLVNKSLQIRDGKSQGITLTASTLVTIVVVTGVIAGIIFGLATFLVRAP